jgi:hypothetical protein
MRGFDDWWAVYPIHRAKKDARKAWEKLQPDEALVQQLITAMQAQQAAREQALEDGEWRAAWPLPATWIRGERWMDEFDSLVPSFSVSEISAAKHWRFQAWASYCKHTPRCAFDEDCLERIVLARRKVPA